MAILARGSVSDRPWGRTLGALGNRGLTGQLTLSADGKEYRVAFQYGTVVAAHSPMVNDAAVRLALTGNLITSSQVGELTRRLAAAPERDEVDVIAELCRLGPDQALRLRRRLIAQRAARTFAIDHGHFVVEDVIDLPIVAGSALDVRTIVLLGARANLSDERLAAELAQLGLWFKLRPEAIDDLPQYGFADEERPILQMFVAGANVADVEAEHPTLGTRTVRAVTYALASCGACEASTVPQISRAGTTRTHAMTTPPENQPRTSSVPPQHARTSTLPQAPGRPGTTPPPVGSASPATGAGRTPPTGNHAAHPTPSRTATSGNHASYPAPSRTATGGNHAAYPAPSRTSTTGNHASYPAPGRTATGSDAAQSPTSRPPSSTPVAGSPAAPRATSRTPSSPPARAPAQSTPADQTVPPQPGRTPSPQLPPQYGRTPSPQQLPPQYGRTPSPQQPISTPRTSTQQPAIGARSPAGPSEPPPSGSRPWRSPSDTESSSPPHPARTPTGEQLIGPRTITESSGVPRPSHGQGGSDRLDRSPSGGVRGVDRSPSSGVVAPAERAGSSPPFSRPGSPRTHGSSGPPVSRTSTRDSGATLRPPGSGTVPPPTRGHPASVVPPTTMTSLRAPVRGAKMPRRPKQNTAATLEIEAILQKKVPMLDRGVDYFTLLGVPVGASPEDVRQTYFMLARKLHPDRLAAIGIDDDERHAQRLMACINEAFAVLNDPVRREEYLSILNRGGEEAVRAEEARADELAIRVMRAEEAFRQGEMALRREQLEIAVQSFTTAVELAPNEPEYQALLAWAKFAATSDKESVAIQTRKALQRAAEAKEDSPTARFYLGRVERMLGREKEALGHFLEVLRIKPNHAEASSEARVLEGRLKNKR